jgi:hypothetical protein
MSATIQATPLTCDQALRIANEDAVRVYRDLSRHRISVYLADDGWHVEYRFDPAYGQGGGPFYVIDPNDGTIKSKTYYQ